MLLFEKMVKRKDKKSKKKILKLILIFLFIILLFLVYFYYSLDNKDNVNQQKLSLDKQKVLEGGVEAFNVQYINSVLAGLGSNKLHKSYVGYGNPLIEFEIDSEIWNSEIEKGKLITKKGNIDNEDLRIVISREEVIAAILSDDIKVFMRDSVINERTKIEQVADKVELGSKGYLSFYNEIS